MGKYKFLWKKTMENLENFEKRMNETAGGGWKIINFSETDRGLVVLFERER